MYYFEVIDDHGAGWFQPDPLRETPYYVVGETGLNVKETVVVTRTGCQPMNRSHRGLVVLD